MFSGRRLGACAPLSHPWMAGLAAALVLLLARPAVAAPFPGDLDGNGQVNVADVLLGMRALVGLQALSPLQSQAADLDGAGRLTTSDLLLILRLALGLSPQVSLALQSPADGLSVRTATVHVAGTVRGPVSVVDVNGAGVPVSGGAFATDVPLADGANVIEASAHLPSGGHASVAVHVTRDTTPPILAVSAPGMAATVNSSPLTVSGTASDNSGHVSVTVNNTPATLASDGSFSAPVTLATGGNSVKVLATDAAGNVTEQDLSVQLFISRSVSAAGSDGTVASFPEGALDADAPLTVTPLGASDLAALPGGAPSTQIAPSADPSRPTLALLGADRALLGGGKVTLLLDPTVTACPGTPLKPGDPVYLTEMRPNPANPGHSMLTLVDTMSVSADGRQIVSDPHGPNNPYPGFKSDIDMI